ncbi:tubulin-specific chaperone A-like isoform X1 [Acropora muricata]|uniref:tubulin-specific chaperone A-like isoform X1 n=1 Tax=Acropora muricata TaxID=159855 RepID=UPI0034E5C7E8
MASASDPKRQLHIKTGVLKRLSKEKVMYEKEVVDQSAKIDKMKAENKDEHDIKKQIEVLEESKIMIPDCKRRIKSAYNDLQTLVASTEADCADLVEFKNAKELLEKTVLED